ncbi:SIR2 family protein [Bacillus velezensis]|uniref:SIR2 family protein n=1 Tax=Bacillus velezensis TaxID=492670 RepID=UPI00227E22A1|nr:SIR2 family protein [Bacillus velezensis]MCY9255677.1 SIR2 family protein [Bacillus spizizenii]WGS38178.1 SIR2 family protein [Bacillus velezensis]
MSNYDSYLNSSLDHLKQYIAKMNSRPILFVGSGFSQRYINSPTWKNLLIKLIDDNPEIKMPIEYFIQNYNGDYAKIGSELVGYYQDYAWKNYEDETNFPSFLFKSTSKSIHLKYKIARILIEHLEQFDPETHELKTEIELIQKLNPHAIVTTNYDNLLETLFPKFEAIVGQQVIHQKKSTNIGHILKIHGSVDDCNSIIIEQQDYDNFRKNHIYLIAKLFTYFMEHPIIFIGYSLSDENIKSILYNVKRIIDPDTEPIIDNIWFVDWSREPIDQNETPFTEKSIPVGNGESVRLNYIKLHTYEKLYKALYQDSVDIGILKQIEETVYNVVKSDSITNLEVDIVSLRYLTDRELLLNSFTSSSTNVEKDNKKLFTFVDIQDPNQLAAQFTLTATELCKRVYDGERSHWHHAYELIYIVSKNTGVNLRGSNNMYHVNMNQVTRFSMNMVHLLKKVKNMEPYEINIDGKVIAFPPAEK